MKNQIIECCVRDCRYCTNGKCSLDSILISNDIRNEYSKFNTMCQSYEQK